MGTIEKRVLSEKEQTLIEELANTATIKMHGGENAIPCAGSVSFINEAKEDHEQFLIGFEMVYREIMFGE